MQFLIRALLLVGLLYCLEAQTLKCQKSNSNYICTASVNDNYIVHWTLRGIRLYLRLEAKTFGWVGICFPLNAGKMVPADNVIGWVKDNQEHVKPYYIEGYTVTSDNVNPDVTLRNTTGAETDGWTAIEFCLNLTQLTYGVDPQEVTPINWAYGNTDGLVYHGPRRRGSATVRFADGQE